MTQREKYTSASREFLAKAQEALEQDDLAQASEKGWGAAAQMVKAIAEQKGWQHNGHAYLFQTVRRLVEETGDNRLNELFHIANSLHSNFYENWLPVEMVQSGLDNVREFISKLEPLLR
jgi:uncharacterized protein (UPF0332 family)